MKEELDEEKNHFQEKDKKLAESKYIARSWSETTFLMTIPFNKSSINNN